METTGKKDRIFGWADCSALIIGVMLGSGIFVVFPKLAAAHNPSVFMILLSWVLGTFVALAGAWCYAELASVYPENGGDYAFLRETYSHQGKNPISFLFAWVQILVIRPASIISLAILLGLNSNIVINRASVQFFGTPLSVEQSQWALTGLAMVSILLFYGVCFFGLRFSKRVQNTLTIVKIVCLGLLILVGLYLGRNMTHNLTPLFLPYDQSLGESLKLLGMALIPIMWVFGGWNEAPYIAGDMRNPTKNLPKAMLVGLLGLGALYVIVNFVYMLHLKPAGLASSWTFASDLMGRWFGPKGEIVMALVLVLSAAGAISALTLTGGNMTDAFSKDFKFFRFGLEEGNRENCHRRALTVNLFITIVMAIIVQFHTNTIDRLLVFTAGMIWLFFALTVLAVFINRRKMDKNAIPFKVPFYPYTPLLFLVVCGYMIYGALDYKPQETLWGIGLLILGIPVYYLTCHYKAKTHLEVAVHGCK